MVTRAEFLMRAMKMLPRGWTTVRIAWGMMTWPNVAGNVSPSDRPASAWPTATELIPALTASATNEAGVGGQDDDPGPEPRAG